VVVNQSQHMRAGGRARAPRGDRCFCVMSPRAGQVFFNADRPGWVVACS
jgi:hypothetical protein